MNRYFLLDKGEKIFFDVPPGWRLENHFMPERKQTEKTVGDIFQRALSNPISAPPLREMIKPNGKVTILVDDGTRPHLSISFFPHYYQQSKSWSLS
jgi:nickel-dependent lactate racemase